MIRFYRPIALFALCLALALPAAPVVHAMTEQIAAVVNSDAITGSDVNDRVKLLTVSSGLQNTPEIREKLEPQALNILIEEQIKLQEAERLGLEVKEAEIDEGFAQLSAQNKFSAEQFKEILAKSGINVATMRRQIAAQLAWTKVIQAEIRPRIQVSESDVQATLSRLRNKIGTTEYLVAEIFLAVDRAENESNVRALADRLSNEIRSGQAPFFKVAQQFSQSAGAAKGGDIGWVQEGVLAEEIDTVLARMEKDQTSHPVKTPAGYHILLLRDRREIAEDTLPSIEQITNSIGLERMDGMQRRHLMDLKAAAFIDSRV